MESVITRGEQKRLILTLFKDGSPCDLDNVMGGATPTPASNVRCTLKCGGWSKQFTSDVMGLASSGRLTCGAGLASGQLIVDSYTLEPPVIAAAGSNQVAVYLTWTDTQSMPLGIVSAEVHVYYDATPLPSTDTYPGPPAGPSPSGREVIYLVPARVYDPQSHIVN